MTGSEIAKSGFTQEDVLLKFFNETSVGRELAKDVFKSSAGDLAVKVFGQKHDLQIGSAKLQVKKYSGSGFNQCDRRPVDDCVEFLSEKSINELKNFTGETFYPERKRTYPRDFSDYVKNEIFQKQEIILKNLLLEPHSSNYLIGVNSNNIYIALMKNVYDLILSDPVIFNPDRTTIQLGKFFSWQRKGGDKGQITATHIQAKMKVGKVIKTLQDESLVYVVNI